MIHINYMTQKNRTKRTKSSHFEVSDTKFGINQAVEFPTQFNEVKYFERIEQVIDFLEKSGVTKLNYDIPQQLPHIEIFKGSYKAICGRGTIALAHIEDIEKSLEKRLRL